MNRDTRRSGIDKVKGLRMEKQSICWKISHLSKTIGEGTMQ